MNNNAYKYTNAYKRGKNGDFKIVTHTWAFLKDKTKLTNKRIILSRAGMF